MLVLIVLNGYPGVGKLTIARELGRLLPRAKVFSNHLLIDAAAALFHRDDPGFMPMRRELKAAMFRSLVHFDLPDPKPTYLIFTEALADNAKEAAMMAEYLDACQQLGPGVADLVSVIVSCSEQENARRLAGRANEQHDSSTKLLDVDILHDIRESEVIHRFGDKVGLEIELQSDGLTPQQSAQHLSDRIAQYMSSRHSTCTL